MNVYVDLVVKNLAVLRRGELDTAALFCGVVPGTPPDAKVLPTLSAANTRVSTVTFVAEPHAIRIWSAGAKGAGGGGDCAKVNTAPHKIIPTSNCTHLWFPILSFA